MRACLKALPVSRETRGATKAICQFVATFWRRKLKPPQAPALRVISASGVSHRWSLAEMFESVWRSRYIVAQLSRRDISSRYRGSVIGFAWSFINPLLMLIIYTFFFTVIFKARWGAMGAEESKTDFAIILFAGLLIFNFFSECVNRAPGIIISNTNFVKRIVFPIEILPASSVVSALFNLMTGTLVLIVVQALVAHRLPPTVLLFPIIIAPLVLIAWGFSSALASLGVFYRDISQLISTIVTGVLFLSPVFYPITALPERIRPYILLNPVTIALDQGRSVLIWGTMPRWDIWSYYMCAGLLVAWGGFAWFQRTRRGFSDVL